MRPCRTLAIIAVTAGVLALTACGNNKPNSPGDHFNEMAQGAKQGAAQAKTTANDSAIKAHVKARLAANQGLTGLDIHVSTQSGIVTLTGRVDSKAAKTLAAQITSKTDDVRIVVDKLTVKSKS